MKHCAIATPSMDGDREFQKHANELRDRLGNFLGILDRVAAPHPRRSEAPAATEARVRQILKMRRNRDNFFEAGLFADPAWDILLELYAAELAQRRVSVSSLCVGAAVPSTTGLRWIKGLEQNGMIERTEDPMDARRFFLSLSNTALRSMDAYFESLPASVPLV